MVDSLPAGVQPNPITRSRRLRQWREYLTAYLMVAPSLLLIFVFGIFPVGFALYVSLNKWRLKRSGLIGIENYVRAIDNLIYILLFALSVAALVAVYFILRKIITQAGDHEEKPWLLVIPGGLHAGAAITFIIYLFYQLPEFLAIGEKIVGKAKTRALFQELLAAAFRAETVQPAWRMFFWVLILSVLGGVFFWWLWRSPNNLTYQANFALVWISAATGVGLLYYTVFAIQQATLAAVADGIDPGIWVKVISILAGVILLILAWFLWQGAEKQISNLYFALRLVSASLLLTAAWILIGQLPLVLAAGDPNLWKGLKVTVYYSLGTVPFQLGISLFLSILLFQKLRGSEMFRIMFFMPYVTPAVASAAIFKQLFSNRPQALINQFVQLFGVKSQQWLRDPKGIFTTLAEGIGVVNYPDWAAGPSVALVVIMIFSIWTFVGYDTVIYLAGLGNIPTELIEAAEIDGANKWGIFKGIIFPLLSPTTYFLTLISIIGTFKAFNHIWVMRDGLALGATDTFSVTIFIEFFEKLRYGYASALAFVLFAIILSLTFINNKVQGSRVFYG